MLIKLIDPLKTGLPKEWKNEIFKIIKEDKYGAQAQLIPNSMIREKLHRDYIWYLQSGSFILLETNNAHKNNQPNKNST